MWPMVPWTWHTQGRNRRNEESEKPQQNETWGCWQRKGCKTTAKRSVIISQIRVDVGDDGCKTEQGCVCVRERGEKRLCGHLPDPFSRGRCCGRRGGELSGLLRDERVRRGAGALHAWRGGGGFACECGRTLTRHPGCIHDPDAHTGDKHVCVIYNWSIRRRGKRWEGEGGKERRGERGITFVSS